MGYLGRRVVVLVVTLWAAVTANFVIPRLMPGNPADAVLGKFAGAGGIDPAQKQAIEAQLGIQHGSLLSQYWQYLKDIAQGHFGVSYTYFPQPVSSVIGQALPWPIVPLGTATLIAFLIGTLLGIAAAWRRGGPLDTVATVGSTFTSAFPYFWTALLLLFVFGFELGWFPIRGGYGNSTTPNWSLSFVGEAAYHSVLPGLTIILLGLGGWVLGMRNNMINTLGEDYVAFAEANGLHGRTVATRYAARNAILPNLTVFGLTLGLIVGGSILVEVVFGYPGIGYALYNAVGNQDYPLMQAIFLVITISVLLANFVV